MICLKNLINISKNKGSKWWWVIAGAGSHVVSSLCLTLGQTVCTTASGPLRGWKGTESYIFPSSAPLHLCAMSMPVHWGTSEIQTKRQVNIERNFLSPWFRFQIMHTFSKGTVIWWCTFQVGLVFILMVAFII